MVPEHRRKSKETKPFCDMSTRKIVTSSDLQPGWSVIYQIAPGPLQKTEICRRCTQRYHTVARDPRRSAERFVLNFATTRAHRPVGTGLLVPLYGFGRKPDWKKQTLNVRQEKRLPLPTFIWGAERWSSCRGHFHGLSLSTERALTSSNEICRSARTLGHTPTRTWPVCPASPYS